MKDDKFVIQLLNIQGLTSTKKHEIEDLIIIQERKGTVITGLVETHQTEDRHNWHDNLEVIERRRETTDKKGGGIMMIQRKNSGVNLKMRNADILVTDGTIGRVKTKIIIVYMSTGNTSESNERNRRIREELEEILNDDKDEEGVILMGDFNGHIAEIGKQNEDRNGKVVKQLAALYNLSILNLEENCIGVKTWSKRDMTSTIDYVLVNNKMRAAYSDMRIDEKQEVCDLSDHNLIQVTFKWESKINWNKETTQKINWYWRTDPASLGRYTQKLETRLKEIEIDNIIDLNMEIRHAADQELKKKYTRKKKHQEDKIEPPWMNRNIRKEIKERKRINRTRRNTENKEEREELWNKYLEKKKEVQLLIKDAIKEYEKKVSEAIRNDKNKVWENIKKLKGEQTRKESKVYNENGEVLNDTKKREAIKDFWTKIYRKHENKIEEEWSKEKQYNYNEEQKMQKIKGTICLMKSYPKEIEDHIGAVKTKDEIYFPKIIREHIDMEAKVTELSEEWNITETEVLRVLKRIKKGKSPGPDGLKGELYAVLAENKTCIEALTRCLRNELDNNKKPTQWKMSRTVLIGKKAKPTAKDFRPLALTDISYKIFMALIRNRIEEQLVNNNEVLEEQSGFTNGARIEDNIAIVKYLIDNARKTKKQLIITGIDFSKAFDSVKREKIIETLKLYKIEERIIRAIADIYTEDIVEINLGGDFKENIVASSGIRQGCTLSSTLFKLITYRIIKEMEIQTKGYQTGDIEIRTLFYADDGLVVNENIQQASHSIRKLQEIAINYGLEINKDKSSILTFNVKNQPSEIEGIKTTKEMKYLGIWIEDKRDIFKKHKDEKLMLAQRLSNATHSVISRSCNRMLIGKTYWKNVALPAILYGNGIIEWKKKEEERLQIIQNNVCRKILNAPKYATITSMRGDIGISMMRTRMIQGRIGYISNRLREGNKLIKYVMEKLINGGAYEKILKKESEELRTNKEQLLNLPKNELKRKIYAWDTEKWIQEMDKKKTMHIYRTYKRTIKEEEYENDCESEVWYRARANCLKLEDKNREGDKICKLCKTGQEDLEHFILNCERLKEVRMEDVRLQKPNNEHTERIIGDFLFDDEDRNTKKIILKRMWKTRAAKLKAEQVPEDER